MKVDFAEHPSPLVWVICMVCALALGFGASRGLGSVKAAPRHVEVRRVEPWPVVDGLLADRGRYADVMGSEGVPEWRSYTPAYFDRLRARRDRVVAWAASRPVPPRIVFVGTVHAPPFDLAEDWIVQAQDALFERVQQHSRAGTVVAIELPGTELPLTPTRYLVTLQANRHDLEDGLHLPDPSGPMTFENIGLDRRADTRSILHLPDRVFVCGEEWPLFFSYRLMVLMRQGRLTRAQAIALLGPLDQLRSEIMLIRTLETMSVRQRSEGVILQGSAHLSHVEALAKFYHIEFLGLPDNQRWF